jgi:ribosomal protein L11 methyltransferase
MAPTLRLSVLVPATRADGAAGILHRAGLETVLWQDPGDLGTEDDPVPPGRVRLVGFTGDEAIAARAREDLRACLRARPSLAPFEDQDWLHKFRAHHPAVRVGRGLVVAPPWSPVRERPGRVVLRIDPGLAFGTGSHASTYLCLRAIIERARRRPLGRVLDVGTGSGLLAFAALRLGARSARGIEPDPEALAAARANARLNGLGRGLRLSEGSAETARGRYDLVLANLVRDVLIRASRALAGRVAQGGALVVSGILDDEADDVGRAFASAGLTLALQRRREGWSALELVRAR